MPGIFGYTESTNIVVVTEGTSGAPATFADFVTADRAGTDTDLLVAGSPASDLALTYAVRPVELKALIVKCIVANKNAEADFIFISGEDWRGAAQTESIDVSAGDGSYTSTKYWSSITTLDCSDNGAGGGTVWADGDLSVTQDIWGVIWDYGNNFYAIDSIVHFGNGSTSTYFKETAKGFRFNDHVKSYANATVAFGNAGANGGDEGCYIVLGFPVVFWDNWNAAHEFYGSLIHGDSSMNPTINFNAGLYVKMQDCLFTGKSSIILELDNSNGFIKYVTACGMGERTLVNPIGNPSIGYRSMDGPYGLFISGAPDNTVISKATAAGATYNAIHASWIANKTIYFRDCISDNWTMTWGENVNPSSVYRQNTCNIHVVDKDGNDLQNVVVDCEDQNTDAVWGAGTITTDADGNITEQNINYVLYNNDGSAHVTTYSPHKFTISKAGYETLILENITVDAPVNWHLELQPATGPFIQKQWR